MEMHFDAPGRRGRGRPTASEKSKQVQTTRHSMGHRGLLCGRTYLDEPTECGEEIVLRVRSGGKACDGPVGVNQRALYRFRPDKHIFESLVVVLLEE